MVAFPRLAAHSIMTRWGVRLADHDSPTGHLVCACCRLPGNDAHLPGDGGRGDSEAGWTTMPGGRRERRDSSDNFDTDDDTIANRHEGTVDTDDDGTPDSEDLDSDGDGPTDADEAGDAEVSTVPIDTDHDGIYDFATATATATVWPTPRSSPREPIRVTRTRTTMA